jgi:predicted kinase
MATVQDILNYMNELYPLYNAHSFDVGKVGLQFGNPEKEVTKIEESMINNYIEQRRTFVINNTNLKLKYRQKIYDIAKKNGYKVELIYIERPLDVIKEVRSGERWEKVINRMIEGMDYPTPNECDIVKYFIY